MSRRILVFSLLLLLCLSGLAFAAEEPDYGGTYVVGIPSDWGEMFNDILYESAYDGEVNMIVYNALVEYDEKMKVIPDLAKSWDISEDGNTITFHLHKGVKFHDGHELTAEDVAYTYRTILHPDYTGVRAGSFMVLKGAKDFKEGKTEELEGIKILDDYTIQFILSKNDAPFIGNLIYGILPAHLLKDIPVAELENADFNRNPVGTGPFKFVEYKSQQYIKLEAFEDYFEGRPYLDQYVMKRVSTDTLPIHFEKNELDWAYNGVHKEHFKKLKDMDHLEGYTYLDMGYSYIGINQTSPKLKDKRVRQALTYGFRRQVIIDVLFKGYGQVANGPIPPVSWAYTDEVNDYSFNQAKARNLLKEAGYIDRDGDGIRENEEGQKLELDLYVSETATKGKMICELFQQMMKLIDVKVNVILMEFNALLEMTISSKDWDMYTMSWGLSPDPDSITIFHSDAAWNDVYFYNEENDRLLEEGKAEMNFEKRKEIYKEWQKLINEELPYIFLLYPERTEIMSNRMRGYNRNPGAQGLFVGPNGYMYHKLWIPSELQD